MPAKLDSELVRKLTDSFPGEGWNVVDAKTFVADRNESFFSDWRSVSHLSRQGGIYAVLLPCIWFRPSRVIHLHAPHTHETPTIEYEFTVPRINESDYGVVYVGRTSNLAARWRGHLSRGERKDGGQVKYGLIDSKVCEDLDDALRQLRHHARIIYTVLPGGEHCANRDILELSLCARFAPPFNIKSER